MKELSISQLLKALTPKRIINVFATAASYAVSVILHKPIVRGKPFVITIEPTNRCNLCCTQCSTGSGRSKRNVGNLDVNVFHKVINEVSPFAIQILLFDQGEPFLHKQFYELIRIAKENKLYVTTSTNGHFLDSDSSRKQLIDSGLDSLIVSVDGATEETYSEYRRGGSFGQVVEGVRQLVRTRQEHNSTTPKIFLQFVVMKHNEHEISRIKQMGNELGVNRVLVKSAYMENAKSAHELLPTNPHFQRYRIEDDRLKLRGRRFFPCRRPWFSATIHWDGSVAPCCFDRDNQYVFGNISNERLFKIWKSKNIFHYRKQSLKNNGSIDICNNCTEGAQIYFKA